MYSFGQPFKSYDKNGIGIWVTKKGANKYTNKIEIDGSDFIKFRLPIKFYEEILKLEKEAGEYNNAIKR